MNKLKILVLIVVAIAMMVYGAIKSGILISGVFNWETVKDVHVIDNSPKQTLYSFLIGYDTTKLKGKKIFFNSWNYGCGPCWRELPTLSKIADDHSKANVVFLSNCDDGYAVSVDSVLKEHNKPLHFQKVDTKKGVRLSLKKLAARYLKYKNPELDRVPLNLIIDENDSIVFISDALSEKDITEINRILQ